MNKINLTIIIPAYNIKDYIQDTVESITAVMDKQTKIKYEIIVINDCSTDNTLEKLNEIKDKIIIISKKKNGGLSEARNTGISLAKGEYIYFLDGDDKLNLNFLNGLGKIKNKPDFIKFESKSSLSPRKAVTKSIHAGSLIIKKDIIKSWKFIPNIYYEDNHFMFKVINFNINKKISGAKGFPFDYLAGRDGSIMNSIHKSFEAEKSLKAMMDISESNWIWKVMFFQLYNSISYQNKKGRFENKKEVDLTLLKYWDSFKKVKVKFWTIKSPFIFFIRYWIKKIYRKFIF